MMSAPVINTKGEAGEKVKLPEVLFGTSAKNADKALAVRVYLSNQRSGSAKTKTRAEVRKTTAKMYRQKGTGRARHGSYSAPIFVGGGVALGPTGEQNYKRKMTKAMTKRAFAGALYEKAKAGKVVVLSGKSKVTKTKQARKLIKNGEQTLVVVTSKERDAFLAFRNLDGVLAVCPEQLNTYLILKYKNLVISEEGLKQLVEIFK